MMKHTGTKEKLHHTLTVTGSKMRFDGIYNVRQTLPSLSEELLDGVPNGNSEWKELIFPSRADLHDSGPDVPRIDCQTCFEASSGSQEDYAFSPLFD